MNAHQIENGVVVNTIVVDSLDVLPNLIEATHGGIDWLWDGVTLTPPPQPIPTQAEYIAAAEAHYDAVAKAKHYDDRYTCALRAGYAGPFQTEGQAFATWMDECNALGYRIMGEVLAGTRPQPTIGEFLAMLPGAPW